MTALALAVAKDCDALPILVILPPFEAQRIGNTLLNAGFIPLLLADPLQGLEFTAALDGYITGIVLGGTYSGLGVEAFYALQTTAYPNIPIVVVHPDHDPTYLPTLAHCYEPKFAQVVVQSILQVLHSAQCVRGTGQVRHPPQVHYPMSVETPEVLTPLERRALFKAAVTLHEITMAQAAAKLGVSYNHLMLVLHGKRIGSRQLELKVAEFIRRPHQTVFSLRRT